jgi:hypothetical protein
MLMHRGILCSPSNNLRGSWPGPSSEALSPAYGGQNAKISTEYPNYNPLLHE